MATTKTITRLISDDPVDGIVQATSRRTVLPRGTHKGEHIDHHNKKWFLTETGVLVSMNDIDKNPRIRLE